MSKKKGLNFLVEKYVRESLAETVGYLLENEEQVQKDAKGKLKPFRHSKDGKEKLSDEQDEPISPSDDKDDEEASANIDTEEGEVELKVLTPEEMGEIDVESIIDEINKMRSGESLKDPGMRERLSAYFDVLNVPERKTLFSFLQGLAQIMSFGTSGTDAARPATYKLKVGEMVVKEKEIEVPKKKSGDSGSPAPSVSTPQQATSPAPIVVGERADKRRVRRRLRELMRR